MAYVQEVLDMAERIERQWHEEGPMTTTISVHVNNYDHFYGTAWERRYGANYDSVRCHCFKEVVAISFTNYNF
jgi:uncharacterized protein YdeI (YjbR/CyaY-like superfamily)